MATLLFISHVNGVIDGLVTLAVAAVIAWMRDTILFRALRAGRWVKAVVTRRAYVPLWIDDESGHGDTLVTHLREGDGHGTIYRVIRSPREVLRFPRSSKRTKAIVLLDTDVTKLADEPKHREQIERRLKEYVEHGGGIVGSHDLIYRRVRAPELQKIFGGRMTDYVDHRDQPVRYRTTVPEHIVTKDLPTEFALGDGEVCRSEWEASAQRLCVTRDAHEIPLVVARNCYKGRVVWLNSGDRASSGLCASMAGPQEHFITLLRNSVAWVSEVRP